MSWFGGSFAASGKSLVDMAAPAESGLSEEAITTLLDSHAPIGPKKKLIVLRDDLNPRLVPGDLPPYRRAQRSSENCYWTRSDYTFRRSRGGELARPSTPGNGLQL